MKKSFIFLIVGLSLFAVFVSAALTQYLFIDAETGVPGDHFSIIQGSASYSSDYVISGSKSLKIQNISETPAFVQTTDVVNGTPMVVEFDFYDTDSSEVAQGNVNFVGVGGCVIVGDQNDAYYIYEGTPE